MITAELNKDALNISIALDNKLAELWYPLHPKFNIYELTRPDKISRNISIPKPVIATVSGWVDAVED